MPTLDKVQETQPQPAPRKAGRPKKEEKTRGIENSDRFFDTLKKIPPHAWSEGKALVKVYRQEPCIDRLASGKPKHIQEYYEPIEGPERIKVDHGSGKYLLFLNYQGPKDAGVREIERTSVDIFDMNFGPKVPEGDWLDEPKNKGWLWAFPNWGKKQPEQRTSPALELAETLNVLDDIQGRAMERARPPEAPKPAEQPSMLEIIKTVKEMMPPPTPPATDNKMLETIVTLMNAQLDRMSRDNSELRKEIAEARKNPTETKPALGILKELMDQAKELGLLPEGGLKGLLGKAEGALQAVTRSRMSGTEEFWQPILVGLFDAIKPALPMVVARMVQPQQPQPGAAALPQGQPQQPQPGTPVGLPTNGAMPPTNGAPPAATAAPELPFNPGQVQNFFITFGPALVEWFKNGKGTGGDFAEWIYDGYGADWQGLKWMHLKQAVGPDNTLNVFKTSPFWPEIAAAEPQFTEFVKQFCEWTPEAAQAVIELEDEDAQEVQQ